MERYVVFDVETPNWRNDRMSAIGVTVLEDGEVARRFYSLVNPETTFDPFNIRLTGITPEQAAKAPTFDVLWDLLEPIFSRGVLVAHNARFDLGVLHKCLSAYGLPFRKQAPFLCTVVMGRACIPGSPNHKLDTLCRRLDIPLDHHNAGSDADACAQLLLHYLSQGADPAGFLRTYAFR